MWLKVNHEQYLNYQNQRKAFAINRHVYFIIRKAVPNWRSHSNDVWQYYSPDPLLDWRLKKRPTIIYLFTGIRSWSRIAPPIHLPPLYRGLRARSRSLWPFVVVVLSPLHVEEDGKLMTGEDDSRLISGGSKRQCVVISSVGGWLLLYLQNAWQWGSTV